MAVWDVDELVSLREYSVLQVTLCCVGVKVVVVDKCIPYQLSALMVCIKSMKSK